MNKFMVFIIRFFCREPCENCGSMDSYYCIDPYDEDINDIKRYCWLCDDCWHDQADAI